MINFALGQILLVPNISYSHCTTLYGTVPTMALYQNHKFADVAAWDSIKIVVTQSYISLMNIADIDNLLLD